MNVNTSAYENDWNSVNVANQSSIFQITLGFRRIFMVYYYYPILIQSTTDGHYGAYAILRQLMHIWSYRRM